MYGITIKKADIHINEPFELFSAGPATPRTIKLSVRESLAPSFLKNIFHKFLNIPYLIKRKTFFIKHTMYTRIKTKLHFYQKNTKEKV